MKIVLILALLGAIEVILGEYQDSDENLPDDFNIPYMAYLQSSPEPCVGTLIDPQWVLTAAHCSLPAKIRLGVYQPHIKNEREQTYSYSLTVVHPNFDANFRRNDLMLIKLSYPASINMHVGTIAIAMEAMTFNETCFIPTWTWNNYKNCERMKDAFNFSTTESRLCPGTEDTLYWTLNDEEMFEGAIYSLASAGSLQISDPDILTWTNQYSLSPNDCWNVLQQQRQETRMNIMCIGRSLNVITSIKEVSAAPAICNGRLHGILSWGKAGITKGSEGFFTEIHPYARWILKTMHSH